MKNAFDKFLIEGVIPSIRKALMKEDKLLKKQLSSSIHIDFYKEDIKGISSYNLTERVLQYVIFRDLCKKYKIFPEDLVYGNSNKRLDISIYKNINDRNEYAEIGIEIKQVRFNIDGTLRDKSLRKLISDFDKIKKAGNKNKYILLFGLYHKKNIDLDTFNAFLKASIDNRKFRIFRLELIDQTYFKTEGYKEMKYYLISLLKLKYTPNFSQNRT